MIVSFFITIYNMSMDNNLIKYQNLSKLFKDNGYQLYLVGGTVRDYLLGLSLSDMDAVTDATPEQMKAFLSDADFTFAKFGSVKCHYSETKFDITTLREENGYVDSRHPENIKFVKDLSVDVKRRDFTINGLYLNDKFEVIDLVEGFADLNNRILRCIGDPEIRIKEDPLRIIRAIRFKIDLNLEFDESLRMVMKNNIALLDKINPDKIKQDLNKMKCREMDTILDTLADFNITHLYNMLEY